MTMLDTAGWVNIGVGAFFIAATGVAVVIAWRRKPATPTAGSHGVEPDAFERDARVAIFDQMIAGVAVPMVHRDGVPWWESPAPPVQHDCRPQTIGRDVPGDIVFRCACGGISGPSSTWVFRNERARHGEPARRVR